MDEIKITETETVMEDGSISVHIVGENALTRTQGTYNVSVAELRACRDVEGTLALTARQERLRNEVKEAVRSASAPVVLVPDQTDAARAARVLEGVTIRVHRTSEPLAAMMWRDAEITASQSVDDGQGNIVNGEQPAVEPAPKLPE